MATSQEQVAALKQQLKEAKKLKEQAEKASCRMRRTRLKLRERER